MISLPPKWFANALAVARHMDQKAAWPWYGRLWHKIFVRDCPCCLQEAEWNK